MAVIGSIVRAAVLAVAVLPPATNAQEQWQKDVVKAAFHCVRHGEAFNEALVGPASTDAWPTLDGSTEADAKRWLQAVRADARMARRIMEAHYGL